MTLKLQKQRLSETCKRLLQNIPSEHMALMSKAEWQNLLMTELVPIPDGSVGGCVVYTHAPTVIQQYDDQQAADVTLLRTYDPASSFLRVGEVAMPTAADDVKTAVGVIAFCRAGSGCETWKTALQDYCKKPEAFFSSRSSHRSYSGMFQGPEFHSLSNDTIEAVAPPDFVMTHGRSLSEPFALLVTFVNTYLQKLSSEEANNHAAVLAGYDEEAMLQLLSADECVQQALSNLWDAYGCRTKYSASLAEFRRKVVEASSKQLVESGGLNQYAFCNAAKAKVLKCSACSQAA